MASNWNGLLLRDILLATKDGDWGIETPRDGFLPYCIIRGSDFPAVRAGDISSVPLRYLPKNTVQRRTLKADDILIETAGGTADRPTGRTLLVTDTVLKRFDYPVTCASFARFLRVDPTIAEPQFVFWYLQHLYQKGEMSQHQVQHTGVARFQYTRFAETQTIPIPPVREQKAICAILTTIDEKIELNWRMNATLTAMSRALFRSWFVRFDPIRSVEPSALRRDVDPAPPVLFPNSLEDSCIGDIPKGWAVKQLADLCKLGRGSSPRPINNYMNGDIPWVKIADATAANGPFLFETKERVTAAGAQKSVTVLPGDLILSNSATCGVPIFAELTGCIHDGWLYFKNLTSISKLYLFHILLELAEHLVHIADGSVQKNLNINLVGQQNILVPPKAIMDEYDEQASVWFARMRQNGIESRTLARLRDTLLPKLLSGEVRVESPDPILEQE
jgi:type I restriction enzyme S subunit